MEFFDRNRETQSLLEIQNQSLRHAQFTVLTGRRRIGKTSLVFHAYKELPFLYFFVSKKAESELCEGYQKELAAKLGMPQLGRVTRFADIFEYVMLLAKRRPVTLFIDELQELEPSMEYKDKDGNTTGKRYTPISFIENIKMAYADFVIDTHKKISLSEDKDDWKAPAWLLERRVKDEYAKEETVNQNNTEKVESINIVYRDPSEDKDRIEKLAQEVKDAINV